ncbi:TetR/AcrR family transcriptional regulator [Yoonia sp. R2331]|uniref:TetR/AcrR family transcriptional regulator n=1 Tax=Yoonia sp. R2331 TaxID=3237238 RepID=UPI0034E4B140
MPDGGSEIKQGRKFDQVLSGAREVFMRDGFEGASVDDIARAAGVSKATLYSYFADKRLLFMEIARRECNRQAEQAIGAIDMDAPLAEILRAVGWEFVNIITSDFGQRIFRICVAEADRFPELGRAFYESGPNIMRTRMIELLECGVARGELAIDDMELAADQFPELCKADLFPRMVFKGVDSFTDAEKQRVIEGAVATFMARYGV